MNVSNVMMWRDGGTITFIISDHAMSGEFRLRTPFAGEPRLLFRDDVQLQCGGLAEKALASSLRTWLDAAVTNEVAAAFERLDSLPEWRNLPVDLQRVVPLHWLRTVVVYLEARTAAA